MKLHLMLAFAVLATTASVARAESEAPEVSEDDLAAALEVRVIDPYLELHTGPGRGYPVIYVVEKGDDIAVVRRRTTWYLIADKRGKTGWVTRESLARTLQGTGTPVALPETRHGDFLRSKVRLGFTVGTQDGSDQISMMAGYRLSKYFGVEAEYGKFFAYNGEGELKSASLIVEPTDRWSFTPFLSLGYGEQDFNRKARLPGRGVVTGD
ncbi:MAG: hypothetical protein CMI02_08730, partial [Oceanospirillaceae bacterium]|nr:hypothetical protein [Oceanospirillaceae bacterium]